MEKCDKMDVHGCSEIFTCQQDHYELQLVECKNGDGEATQFFCINSLTSWQYDLLQQLLLSLSTSDASPSQHSSVMNDQAAKAFGVPRQKCGRLNRSADRLKVEALAETSAIGFEVACV